MKKILRLFSSMKLALLLLGLIVMACIVGGLIPQGAQSAQYEAQYGKGLAQALQTIQLDGIFTAWWFLLLVGLLLVNLLLCSLLRFPAVLRQYRDGFTLAERLSKSDQLFEHGCEGTRGELFFKKMGFSRVQTLEIEGISWRYARRRRLGVWGSWLSHLGMLVIVVGFTLGQLLLFETSVYGVPGQTLPVAGSDLSVTIDRFEIKLRPDDTVEQYIADLTVRSEARGSSVSGRAMVNAPLYAYGKSFFQNATGWAVQSSSYRGAKTLDSRILFTGESIDLQALDADYMPLALVLHALYPDFVNDDSGPRTRSPNLNNPAALFSLYYQGKLVDMNVAGMGYDIKVADYRFVLSQPQPYTLIQVVGDPATPLTAAGGALMLLGLMLAFYFRPEELWMRLDGEQATIFGRSDRGASLFRDRAEITMKELRTIT